MIAATYSDRKSILTILTQAFELNKSVDYVIKGGPKRSKQIEALMEYAFDMCMLFGEVYVSENKKACALILLPHKKRYALKCFKLDLKFILRCTSLRKIKKVIKREEAIINNHPDSPYAHLWLIGVLPDEQGKGYGGQLLNEVMETYCKRQLDLYLETSTLANLPWYRKHGFTLVTKLNLTYPLFILKKDFNFYHALAWD